MPTLVDSASAGASSSASFPSANADANRVLLVVAQQCAGPSNSSEAKCRTQRREDERGKGGDLVADGVGMGVSAMDLIAVVGDRCAMTGDDEGVASDCERVDGDLESAHCEFARVGGWSPRLGVVCRVAPSVSG